MKPITISKQTARRFVLGRQGLWPGRRWKGKRGTAQALRACEAVQLDPLAATARSQDLVLHSRVLDYKAEYLDRLLYDERLFFDYGGWLAVYPMSEMPYWRTHMENRRNDGRVEDFVFSRSDLFDRVRQELRSRGPLGNRHINGNAVSSNYRGGKDSSLALFYMWLTGELMIHHRVNFSRVYDFRENVIPTEHDHVAPAKDAENFFARKCIAYRGFVRERTWKTELQFFLHGKVDAAEMRLRRDLWLDEGMIAYLQIEGSKENYLVLSEDVPVLDRLAEGKVPRTWQPRDTTTLEEVTFISPLDVVSAHGRSRQLFDFEYLWEVYKPAHQRRWGYYTLPILYGDELVARMDPKLDRASMTLEIRGFWHEPTAPVKDAAFVAALANGLVRFAGFLQAQRLDLSGVALPTLCRQLKRTLSDRLPVLPSARA